jgi:hypothetical protein
VTGDTSFTDVDSSNYAYDAIRWAVEQGITTGISATQFGGGQTVSRAQLVTLLWRTNNSPTPSRTNNPFTDVPEDAYYYDAVIWAVNSGITTGTTATTFAPSADCTRAQTVTFLWRDAH